MSERKRVLFGVAGWSYPDWKDVVYPRNCKDTLRAVAEQVDLIEINNTFYRPPSAKNAASWAERTADLGTFFTAKLPQDFTHEHVSDRALIDEAREGFEPLVASGRFLGFLAQFNYLLRHEPASLRLVKLLAETFGRDAPLFVEVRHKSWNDGHALAALQALGVSVAALDYPGMASGFSRDTTGVYGHRNLAYFRLHGRNQAWFVKEAGRDEVYDWTYSPREVAQLEQRIDRIRAEGAETLVVANNHFHGKAMKVVKELLAWYRGASDGDSAQGGEQPGDGERGGDG